MLMLVVQIHKFIIDS